MTKSDEIDLQTRYDLARAIACEAGERTLQYFGRPIDVDRKRDNSPVTVADREAEQLLRCRIREAFPEDGIIGEEFAEHPGSSGYQWILDPIDGTKSFISGVPLYATLVAVQKDQRSIIGVIRIPALDEEVYAAVGKGAWHRVGNQDPQAAVVSNQAALGDGLFLTSERDTFDQRGAGEAYNQLEAAAWITRTWGDAYGYLLVATGRAVAMIDPIMNIWDAAALRPVMEEAGGSFTDWSGQATTHSGEGIGTNGHVLEEVLAMTKPFVKM